MTSVMPNAVIILCSMAERFVNEKYQIALPMATGWQSGESAEAAFRVHKSAVKIRPLWHHREHRVGAHIPVRFLAYVLWKTLAASRHQAGLEVEARQVFEERIWPGIWLGTFVLNLTTAGSAATSVAIATGNTLEGVLGAYLVHTYARGRNAFHRVQDAFKFAFFCRHAQSRDQRPVSALTPFYVPVLMRVSWCGEGSPQKWRTNWEQ